MTSFMIVFEILFLILIASHSFGQRTAQDDHIHNRHAQMPPERRAISTANKLQNQAENLSQPNARLLLPERNQDIYLQHQNSDAAAAAAAAKRRTGRTRRSPRAGRYEGVTGGLALVASSTGLSSSVTTVPTLPKQQEEETSKPATSPPAASSDAQSSSSSSSAAAAELCYLASGGSSLTLTVNEATPVGSLIGTIDVNGDPSLEGGNVDLLDGLDQAASGAAAVGTGGATFSSPDSSSVSSSLASLRQNRRLLGRRDTSYASAPATAIEGVTPAAAALTSAFYALVGSTPAAITTTRSPATTTTATATTTITTTNANQQAIVRVHPGTKNLLLARALDKESPEGESSLLVNVRCRARQSASSPSHNLKSYISSNNVGKQTTLRKQSPGDSTYTTIPIRLIVTDANDQAPEFVAPASGGWPPYVINISETTPVGSVASRDILAIDKDSAGPHSTIHYRVVESSVALAGGGSGGGGATNLFAFTNPLEPTLWLTGPLDYETLAAASFTLTIVAQDQGEPEPLQTSAQVQVNVLDFDDQNPKFLDEKYTLVMDETQASLVGQNLRVLPRNLRAEDGDRGINAPIVYSFDLSSSSSGDFTADSASSRQPLAELNESPASSTRATPDPALNIEQYLHLNPTSGELRLIRQWPSGPASLPLTLVIRATQTDNRDRYALTTLTITRAAAAAAPAPAAGSLAQNPHATTNGSGETARETGTGRQVDAVSARTPKRGIEFAQEHVTVQVAEDTPVSEKIARVRARHLASGNHQGQQQVSSSPGQDSEIVAQQRRLMQLVASSSSSPPPPPPTSADGAHNSRPINYLILDDQTDQFAINGLGEILLKRALDYEQRQEFKFRVLATYTRYSDICHVHVQVMNVNDNKPMFTQSQYSFHLTESRLRSNSLGHVVAQDADLNDTINYSILPAGPTPPQGQCARLFEISPTGQLSLRTGTRAVNTSQCQVIVQATDSLVSQLSWQANAKANQHQQRRHQQQVRVNFYVAPQLIGRSLNLNALTIASEQQPPGEHEAKLFNSRSLHAEGATPSTWPGQKFVATSREHGQLLAAVESSTIASNAHFQQPTLASSQRSSVATVVASLQHMMKSVNLLEMPTSSALLLSVLLTFLVCLLLIVIISMSVHVYRRRSSKSSSRVRHLTAAARMRHAHLVAAAAASAAAASSSACTGSSNAGSSPGYVSPPSSSSSSSSSSTSSLPASYSSPANSHSLASPPRLALEHQQQRPANWKSPAHAGCGAGSTPTPSPPGGSLAKSRNKQVDVAENLNIPTSPAGSNKGNNASTKESPPPPQPPPPQSKHQPLGQLKISISSADEPEHKNSNQLIVAAAAPHIQINPPATRVNPLYLHTPLKAALKSPLGSYRSAISSTDDSTSSLANNCGHYSVNGTMEVNPRGPPPPPSPPPPVARHKQTRGDKLEQAISELVRQETCDNRLRQQQQASGRSEQQQQLAQLIAGDEAGEVRAYRPLPMMSSLVRPLRMPQLAACGRGNKVAPFEQLLSSHQQRIEQQEAAEHQQRRAFKNATGLMARVRESVQLSGHGGAPLPDAAYGPPSPRASESTQIISWPSGSIPHKIKKLTWDDEMSCCDNDVSMLGMDCDNNPIQERALPEQDKFLFSLNSHMQLPSLNQQQQQQQQQFAATSLDRDPSFTLDLEGRHHQHNHHNNEHNYQNNCLDYTFVESSQFHVDSLASSNKRNIMITPRSYNQDTRDQQRQAANNQRPDSRTSQSQDATTFKLNQNYQDLKLMTAAVL